jgi:putative Ca2+/H+ antiporter (TMEM165/GDT1 family)
MIEAFGVTYLAVLAAEVVGDKFLFTTGILATRYRPTPLASRSRLSSRWEPP